jgi:hypothetical protein
MIACNVGEKFGSLEVIALDTGLKTQKRGGPSRAYVMCRCCCGEVIPVRKSLLHRGRQTTCARQSCPRSRKKKERQANYHIHRDGELVLEHRAIAEEMLGRKLEKEEVVHHVNGIKTDNRPENLEVVSANDHRMNHIDCLRRIGVLSKRVVELENRIRELEGEKLRLVKAG